MSRRIALCVDEATCANPASIGLEGELLESQDWLALFTAGDAARREISADDGIEEAWVVSCDDVAPINLAASLKADRPDLHVQLVEFDGCGSLFSRAHTALIDEVHDRPAFVRAYAEAKAAARPAAAPLAVPAPVFTATAGRAFLMPVVSGSGGAGKSSVAVMAAFIAWERGCRTLLLDYDLQFGDTAIMAGVESPLAVDAALAHPERLEREMLKSPGLTVLAAPERLEAADAVVRALPQLLDDVADAFDVIVANTGAAWAEQHAALLERSSAALFLIDQRASSLWACKHALELCARCGIASGPFRFAVNRCAKNALLTSIDVSCALQGAPVFELKDGGRDVEEYLGGGAAAELLGSGNEFCTSLERALERIVPGLGQGAPAQGGADDDRRVQRRRGRHAGRKRGRGSS